jgi:hypothetical protein
VSIEMLGILVSVATLLVVAAAAVAAIVQLKHLRTSNQLAALLEIMNQWNLPAVQAALSDLRRLPERIADPDYIKALRMPGPMDRSRYPEFLALDLWEQIGTFSKRKFVDEAILLDIASAQVSVAWRNAQPVIEVLRERGGQSSYENFEYLAVRATLFMERFPNGTYPAGMPRMGNLS